MAKLQLNPNPTFTGRAAIPLPGGESAEVVFTFKHRTKDAVTKWLSESKDREDVQTILEAATGWDLDEPFNAESLTKFCQNYIGGPVVVIETYIKELTKAKLGN